MVLRSMAEHRITARTVRPATIIVSRMVLLWQARHPLVELHVHGFRNSFGNLAIFAAIRAPHRARKTRPYCCVFFAPAPVGVFGLGVPGAGRMAPQGSFGF
jgi:hypothetical protein